ncbi:MAG: PDZ domain-containing protein [Phycisphaerae bacterium]|nr:PDZ domain-containing protein [Phycisphaerae bacterium]
MSLLSITSRRALILGIVASAAVAAPVFWPAGAHEAAWLGCQIGPVPKSLDAHLALDGKGAIVLNVAKESPADNAALERYDVVLKVGDDPVASPQDLIDRLAKRRPGDKVLLRLMRKGKEVQAEVTLAPRPVAGKQEYKYEELPDIQLDDRLGVRGKLFRKGPDGWELKDLGEVGDLPDLLRDVLPRHLSRRGTYWLQPGNEEVTKFQARVSRDGKIIEVDGQTSGPIKVTRTETDKTVEATYDTPENLKQADPEAYEIYLEATGRKPGSMARPAHPLGKAPKPRDLVHEYQRWMKEMREGFPSLDRKRLDELHDRFRRDWDEGLNKDFLPNEKLDEVSKGWSEALDAAKKQLQELERDIQGRIEQYRAKAKQTPQTNPSGATGSASPIIRFEVASDGNITVYLRDGDAEVRHEFRNIQELKAKRPGLYAKLQSVLEQP